MKTNYTDKEWNELASVFCGEKERGESFHVISEPEKSSLYTAWNDIGKHVIPEKIDVDRAWRELDNRIGKQEGGDYKAKMEIIPPGRSYIKIFSRVAAVLIFLVASVWLFFSLLKPGTITVVAGNDQRNMEVLLDDGSRVMLNRNSELTYPTGFGTEERRVELVGEAFFDVERDEFLPFYVVAGIAEIRVLGTSFNVITGNPNDEVEIFVETGKVEVYNKRTGQTLVLDEGVIGKVSEDYSLTELNDDVNYMSWNTGILEYEGTELDEVFSDLRRVYGIDIEITDQTINDLTLTSDFYDLPEETVIRLICTTFNLNYSKSASTYILSLK